METIDATAAFAALGQGTRLAIFRLLIRHAPDGLAAGAIGSALDVLPNTLTANLQRLAAAGLIASTRHGRSIRYAIDVDGVQRLLRYLLEDCCGGRTGSCEPLLDELFAPCCHGATRGRIDG